MLYGYYLVLLYDLWKITFGKNRKWKDSENLIYTYSDFILMDFKELKVSDIIGFIIFIKIFYFVFKIYILIVILFIINAKIFNVKVDIKWDNILGKVLKKAFIKSKILSKIKLKNLFSIRVLWKILFQLSFLIIWGYPKIIISYGIYNFKFIKNWFRYGNRSFKDLEEKIINLLENSILEDYQNCMKCPI
jgi:hypothetical protein